MTDANAGNGEGNKAAAGEGSKQTGGEDASAKLDHQIEINRSLQAKLTHYEKNFGGVNIDKLKADSAELQRVLESSKDPEAIEAAKKRLESTYKDTLEAKDKKIEELSKSVKNYRVTTEAMKKHSQFFVEKSENLVQDLVDRFADWDDKAGRIVIKDATGQPRYSKTKGGELLGVDEFFQEIATDYPFLAKGTNKSGTMTGSQNSFGGSNLGGFAAPANAGTSVDAAKEFFRKNPDALEAYMNGSLKV